MGKKFEISAHELVLAYNFIFLGPNSHVKYGVIFLSYGSKSCLIWNQQP